MAYNIGSFIYTYQEGKLKRAKILSYITKADHDYMFTEYELQVKQGPYNFIKKRNHEVFSSPEEFFEKVKNDFYNT